MLLIYTPSLERLAVTKFKYSQLEWVQQQNLIKVYGVLDRRLQWTQEHCFTVSQPSDG